MTQPESPIIGIDLGTTNSVVAVYMDGKVRVLQEEGEELLPSVVGLTMDGKLAVGRSAKNQLAAFPDRTIASVKRRMGQAVKLKMGDQEFTPQEISAMILRRMRQRAEQALGTEVTRAVITVPAFFDEHQRQATQEAGQLAGLTVERIINEPTAASLVYHAGSPERRHLIVYDLGGGTFDVSIVRMEQGVVEVLSSKGDTQLGGDDFDQLLAKYVADIFLTEHGYDLMSESTTRWRLMQTCERAKCELSTKSVVRVSEEFIATIEGRPVNLDVEILRHEYEELISALVERTIQCVDDAIRDSGLLASQLDELVLVGGSSRTPLVQRRLREEFQRDPLWSVNPDLAVALGAATQAAMQSGYSVGPVLIDVATHTLGIEVLHREGFSSELRFCPIIRRNSPLPAKYEDVFLTVTLDQDEVEIHVFQGESMQLIHNRSIGRFRLEGLNESDDPDGEVLVRFELTLDGTLNVTAVERQSGRSKSLTIENALSLMGEESRQRSIDRLDTLFTESDEFSRYGVAVGAVVDGAVVEGQGLRIVRPAAPAEAAAAAHTQSKLDRLLATARSVRSELNSADGADVDRLVDLIASAQESGDDDLLSSLETELDDLMYYLNE
jgi:molecular chaperone DnaK